VTSMKLLYGIQLRGNNSMGCDGDGSLIRALAQGQRDSVWGTGHATSYRCLVSRQFPMPRTTRAYAILQANRACSSRLDENAFAALLLTLGLIRTSVFRPSCCCL
jgi:hypothetical protein